MVGDQYYAGIDVGSSATKAVIINDQNKISGSSILKTGISYNDVSQRCFNEAIERAGISKSLVVNSVTTGYGRRNTPISDMVRTEISCIAKGAYHFFPQAITVIDIGGQDNKMIKLDEKGRRVDFQMNRKCAAGTGAFIEEIANRLDLNINDISKLAERSTKKIVLGSYCTVFTFTEILSHMERGVNFEDLARGVLFSIVKRIFEFGIQNGDVVLTGGVVEYNRIIADMLMEEFNVKVLLPPHPQLICALGAALYSHEQYLTS